MADLRVASLRRASTGEAGPVFGSGHLVADRLVLTAAHVAGAVADTVEVRLGVQIVTGSVVWQASAADDASSPPDAALIEIDDAGYQPADLPPVRWGRLVGRGTAVGCTATGFPDALVAPDGRARSEQLHGEIMPLTRDADGLVDVRPASWPEPGATGGSLWSGMSGAAVLSGSGQLTVAIVIEIAENFGDRRLTALTVDALRHDRSFTSLVEQHTGRPFLLEPVELEETLRPWYRSTRPQSPIALLRPEYEVVPFHGRAQTLDRLVSWCESGRQVGGLLIHAGGGTGKTRLARELARTMYQKGWVVGELSDAECTFGPFTRLAHPALVLVDYAESRAENVAALLRHIAEHPGQHPVRVLILSRSAGPWWTRLSDDDIVAATLPDEPEELGGLEFSLDSDDRLTALADAFDTALRQVPGYEDHQGRTPAFQLPWTLEPIRAHHPLTLHTAVLASVLTGPDSGEEPPSPARIMLRHEKKYWNRLAVERSLGHPETREAALVFGLLCGAHSRQGAAQTVGLLPGFRSDSAEEARRALAHWIATLYPPADPRAEYWGQLSPDWLFEYLLATTMADEPDLLDNLARLADDGTQTCLTEAQLSRAVTVLTAAAAHPGEAAAAVRRKLIELVALHNDVFLPFACHVSTSAQYPEPLLTALKVLVDHPSAELPHLYQIRSFMPPVGGVLTGLGVAVQRRIIAVLRAAPPETEDQQRELAAALSLLGTYLARADRVEEAAAASGEAVTIHRSLHEGHTESQDLALALTSHATNLARLGDHTESYRICQEVVDVLEHSDLARGDRRMFMAVALNNIFLHHEEHGDLEQANEALTRAIGFQREELTDGADHFALDTLAQLLTNQGRILEQLGQPAEALAAHEECVEIWRRLYRAAPGAYADRFQAQAMLLAGLHEAEGRHTEAAALYGQASEALTRLPLHDPEKQLRLGAALQLQAQELSRARAPFASAVHVLERSCAVLGRLFRSDPEIGARHYFAVLKTFIQGTQLVAEDIDIRPYMAEVAGVLDHIVGQWEAAGHVPDDPATVPDLAMYVAWAVDDGDPGAAIRLCERVEALATDGLDETGRLDRQSMQGSVMMMRAKALARRGDVPEAVEVAKAAAERLAQRATPENHWPAFVAVEGLLDMALRVSPADAPHEIIALNRAGSAIALRHVAETPEVWAPMLANHMAQQARTHARLGEHEAAAALFEQTLGYVRGLTDSPEDGSDNRFVLFDVRLKSTGPSRHESLDEILSMYLVELRSLGRIADFLAALAELVELRRRLWEADERAERALSYAWIARVQAEALLDSDQPEAAATAARTAMAVARGLSDTDDAVQENRALILHDSAIVLVKTDAIEDAVTSISACVGIYRTAYEPSPTALASALGDLSAILGTAGRTEEARTAGDQALALWRDLAAGDADELYNLAVCLHNQALAREQGGFEDEARELRAEFEALIAQETE
ncbi:trypsin-like peptidase domain-containing protein [Streptomyces chryseus]|uniref:trypsin-like peptidase domain-containing protein n=1 Tax=Streptomyces chryseus TaxID=68186 RepID=UPI001476FDA8|nr:trypsin-like peptidase domain-containing protein [Streptomyces chryseus]